MTEIENLMYMDCWLRNWDGTPIKRRPLSIAISVEGWSLEELYETSMGQRRINRCGPIFHVTPPICCDPGRYQLWFPVDKETPPPERKSRAPVVVISLVLLCHYRRTGLWIIDDREIVGAEKLGAAHVSQRIVNNRITFGLLEEDRLKDAYVPTCDRL